MDDVEFEEKQQVDEYIEVLENTIKELNIKIKKIQYEKEELFNKYIDSLYELFSINK